jgi:hypothetical protein
VQYTGGTGYTNNGGRDGGAGGGGGWYGGGGGGAVENNCAGGGGGSGFVGRNGGTALTGSALGTDAAPVAAGRTDTVAGVTYTNTRCLVGLSPYSTAHPAYNGSAGYGGTAGLVVIEY